MPLILGGVGAAVLVIVLVIVSSKKGGDDGDGDQQDQQQQAQPETKPHVPKTTLKMGSAQAGKTPDRPAPRLTVEMLQQARDLIQEAKVLNNEGVKLRNAGKNMEARAKQSEAKRKTDEVKALLDIPATWQEEADMEGWAMPAEYVTLGNLYGEIAKLEKRIRMSGGQ
ncbi:MAG: hypothetical protein KAI24_18890 [Planctomycetes bacterium]|nr:hypothetical protein [Planctomycetota bacterium]